MRSPLVIVSIAALAAGVIFRSPKEDAGSLSSIESPLSTTGATQLLNRQPGFFVPNLGQWNHPAKFVHRSGPMTVFLEERGWILDLVESPVGLKNSPQEPQHALPGNGKVDQKTRGIAVRMTFEGDAHVPEIVGEKKLPGHQNYFLGTDESRWRTGVPLYSSVRYEDLYPGIDLRLREMNGVPEYDVLLQPGADLTLVSVRVEGAQGLSIAGDGSLVIETALGPVNQSVPRTWEVGPDGMKREVVCNVTLLGTNRFGFTAPSWDGDTDLTIDPGLVWSTMLGGSVNEEVFALSVDESGVVTAAGRTVSRNFPATIGAYATALNYTPYNGYDAFVCCLDPGKTGTAQLVYSTFLGGTKDDAAVAMHVDVSGVVTLAGGTYWDFPTTGGAYDRTFNGGNTDAFICRLDPRKAGAAQLVYSTFLGGSSHESLASGISVDVNGVATFAGTTYSSNFPTTVGAYDRSFNGGSGDVFVGRLDPSKTGTAQLVYSTFLGGTGRDAGFAISVADSGLVTVAGWAGTSFPTTSGVYNTTLSAGGFISCLDSRKTGSAQLVYSTLFEGYVQVLSVAASGVMTVAGGALPNSLPTTSGAYDTTFNGGNEDLFVSRLDPSKTGTAQLIYSTYLGGGGYDERAKALSVDANGVVTLAGYTESTDFPTTSGAYDTTLNGTVNAFVSRLDPSKVGTAQLVYSTFFGGANRDYASAMSVDASGVVNIAGKTYPAGCPTTSGAYDTTHNGGSRDAFISRLDMGVALYGDAHELSTNAGGTQHLTVNAGKAHANRLYWVFGSITGTQPGINLLGVHIPLTPDLYTDAAMANVNQKEFTNFKGRLNANGLAAASFNVPANLPVPSGFTFHHAYVVYDSTGKFYMASNAVPVRLK